MPIKKHIVRAEAYIAPERVKPEYVFVRIPESICSAMGIGEGTPLKMYSNNNGYSFTVEVPLSFENLDMLNRTLERNTQLNTENAELKTSVELLKKRVAELENML